MNNTPESLLPDNLAQIGIIRKPHALRGELNAELEVDDEYLEDNPWIVIEIEGIPTPFRVVGIRPKSAATTLLRIEGVEDADSARPLVNRSILTSAEALRRWMAEAEESDGMFLTDFRGYTLLDNDGSEAGVITDVDLSTEANPLFNVKAPDGTDFLVPASDALIEVYDPDARTITMNLPTGLR